jgi:hypothetical protein
VKSHFKNVLDYVRRTDQNYRSLYVGNHTPPIPFFGNPESALVLTVGLNPSIGEFDPHRGWPDAIADLALETRLQNYFLPNFQPHPFFSPWMEAFEFLTPRISYASGTAAHLDLSPRATDFPSNHQTNNLNDIHWREQFLKMLGEDVFWFFEALKKCKQARLVLMAGTATDQFYLNQIISKYVPSSTCLQFDESGDGRNVSFHNLIGLDFKLPVFFSGAGPAFQRGARLVQNVYLNRDKLNSKLRPGGSSTRPAGTTGN